MQESIFRAFFKFGPKIIHAPSLMRKGDIAQFCLEYFPICSDFKTTTNSISSKCNLSTSYTTLFKIVSFKIGINPAVVDTATSN